MEKKRSGCPIVAGCERIVKAISAQTIHPISQDVMTSNHAPNSSPLTVKTHISPQQAKPVEAAQQHLKTLKAREAAAQAVPVKFNYSRPSEKPKSCFGTPHAPNQVGKDAKNVLALEKSKAQPGNMAVPSYDQVTKVATRIEPQAHVLSAAAYDHQQKLGVDVEDGFTDYINRAKCRIRTTSSSVHDQDNVSAGEDKDNNGKDHFSDFIRRAKIRIRTMSSFTGGGRSDSNK